MEMLCALPVKDLEVLTRCIIAATGESFRGTKGGVKKSASPLCFLL